MNIVIFLTFSLYTMTTFGYFPENVTITRWGFVLTTVQAAIGLIMTLLILARFSSFFPKPHTSIKLKKRLKKIRRIRLKL